MNRRNLMIIALLTIGLTLAACSPGENPDPQTTGQAKVVLTDAPASEAESLMVTFGRIELIPAGGDEADRVVIAETGGSFDVLTLRNGTLADLGVADVPVGTYAQVRVIVDEATIDFDDGNDPYDVFVPSGAQTGLKISVDPPLVVEEGSTSTVILDFDADRAVVETPPGSTNYNLVPTGIRAVAQAEAGVVTGIVADEALAAVGGATVTVYPAGETEAVAMTTTEADGSFQFVGLLEGTYDLEVDMAGFLTLQVPNVSVTAGETTDVGQLTLTAIAP